MYLCVYVLVCLRACVCVCVCLYAFVRACVFVREFACVLVTDVNVPVYYFSGMYV